MACATSPRLISSSTFDLDRYNFSLRAHGVYTAIDRVFFADGLSIRLSLDCFSLFVVARAIEQTAGTSGPRAGHES